MRGREIGEIFWSIVLPTLGNICSTPILVCLFSLSDPICTLDGVVDVDVCKQQKEIKLTEGYFKSKVECCTVLPFIKQTKNKYGSISFVKKNS